MGWEGEGSSFPKTRQRVSSVCRRGWVGGRLPWRFGPCLLLNTFFLLVFAHFCSRLSLELVVALRFSRLTAVMVVFEFYFGVLFAVCGAFDSGAEPGFKEECDRSRLCCGVYVLEKKND